jgi:hypothetical protein
MRQAFLSFTVLAFPLVDALHSTPTANRDGES